jgi:RHS repeat-associated protein
MLAWGVRTHWKALFMNYVGIDIRPTLARLQCSCWKDRELKQAVLGNLGHTLTYNLDKMGNRTSVVDNTVTSAYSPNTINQYTTGAGSSVVNGPEHEIQTYAGVSYIYMNDEQLAQVSNGTNNYWLYYDALGRCVGRILNGVLTYYIYDGEKPILEYNPAGGRSGYNLYGKGIDEILKRGANGSDNTWHWYHFNQNHEGSVNLLTDATGTIIERYRYDAFGAPTIYTGTWGARTYTSYDNRFLFTGREYAATYRGIYNTPAFNFYEYRARAYNPTLGRFMSEDPKVFDAGDYNLFRYCHNDPIDFTDSMGTEQDWATIAPREHSEMLAGQKNPGDAVWAMAKWADSSNNFQGTFAQFTSGQGLTMGQNSKSDKGLAPITQDRNLQSRTPRQLGVEAARQAQEDARHDDIYSYNVYRYEGKTYYQKSYPAEAGSSQDTEAVPLPPQGAVFLANGHVHRENQSNRYRGSSHSELDKNLSRGRIPGISGTGPVTFVKEHGNVFYEFYRERVTPLNSEGEPWRP